DSAEAMALSAPHFELFTDLCRKASQDDAWKQLRDSVEAGDKGMPWAVTDGLVTYVGRIYVLASSPTVALLLEHAHGLGHEVCQRNKSEHLQPAGLLQLLELPTMV